MDEFKFFAPAYLVKSGNPKKEIKIGGIISTEDRDIDGEILKSIDWSYFTDGWGKIKYEHKDIPEPDCFIGFPTKLIRKGTKTFFEGDLIPFDPDAADEKLTTQERLSKSTYNFLKHIEEYNTQNPDKPQKAGWSVEGEYLSKDKKTGLVKARVINVVFTTKPRNTHTLAQLVKSLSVGYGMSPSTQTGFGALRKEDLNNNHKIINEVTKMKTKEEFYKSCIDKGMDHKKALEEAERMYAEQQDKHKEGFEKAEKSLSSGIEKLAKSVELAASVEKITIDFDLEDEQRGLAKSIKVSKEDEDVEAFLNKSSELQLKGLEAIQKVNEKVEKLAKSIQSTIEGLGEIFSANEAVMAGVHLADKELTSLNKGILTMNRLLAKSGGITQRNLGEFQVEDNAGDKNLGKPVFLNKSQKLEALDKLVDEKTISEKERSMFVTANFLSDKNEELVKSKYADMHK